MKVYEGTNFSEVYRDSLDGLLYNSEHNTSPRGSKIKEDLNVSLVITDPTSCMFRNERRSSQFKYIAGEMLWYFLGRNDVKFISDFSKFWKQIQNPDGTANSAYGQLIFNTPNKHGHTQYDWAITSLIKDKDSRQAIMHFNTSDHQYFENKDFVCTMYAIFHIRNNKLHLKVNMRSNDAVLGTPTDVAFFTTLQQQALLHLQEIYPELVLGNYTHEADSYHIYERHFVMVGEMLEKTFMPVKFPNLHVDFINPDGNPTKQFLHLSQNYDSKKALFSDNAFTWIQNNVKGNV